MTEWFYKATPTKVSYEETRDLATVDGFICRSAYEKNGTRADNTQHVVFRDLVHFYFVAAGDQKTVGSFEVVGPNRHPYGHRFKRGVPGTALFEVDDAFAARLVALGGPGADQYQPDPVLHKVMGWGLIQRVDVATPSFADAPFYGQATLVRYPQPLRRGLPRFCQNRGPNRSSPVPSSPPPNST